MEIDNSESSITAYQFDEWTLHLSTRELESNGVRKALEPLIFDLLVYFVENAHRVVPRQDLVNHVWQQSFVDDNAINRAISELRKSLQSSSSKKNMIKTLYKKGYQLVPEVHRLNPDGGRNQVSHSASSITNNRDVVIEPEVAQASSQQHKSPRAKHSSVRFKTLLLFIVLGLVVIGYLSYSQNTNNENPLGVNAHLSVSEFERVHSATDLLFKKGLSLYPKTSQNQRFLAYSHQSEGSSQLDIYYFDLNSYQNYIMVKAKQESFPVAIDNQGNLVYQTIERDGGGYICSVWFAPYSAELDMSSHRKIFDCEENNIVSGQLFNDAQRLLFTKPNYRGNLLRSALFHRNLNTGEEYQVTSPSIINYGDQAADLHVNSGKVAFSRDTDLGSALYLTDIEGSELTKLLDLEYIVKSLRFSEDGSKITWLNYLKWELNTLNLVTENVSITKLQMDQSVNPHVAINVVSENRFVYASDYIDNDIYQLNLDTPGFEVTSVATSFGKEVSYLPLQGEYDAVFFTYSSSAQLWYKRGDFRQKLMEFDKSTNVELTRSPNAEAFLVAKGETLYIYDANLMQLQKKIELDEPIQSVNWFDNDNLLVLKNYQNKPTIMIYDLEQRNFTPFTDIPADRMIVTAANEVLIQDLHNTLHLLDKTGKKNATLFLENTTVHRWTADATDLYYVVNTSEVWKRSLNGKGEPEMIYQFEKLGIRNIYVHPDQSALLITVTSFDGNTLYDVKIE